MAKVDHRPTAPQTQSTTESKPSFPSGASGRAQMIDSLREAKGGEPLGKSVSRLAHLKHELKKEGVSKTDAQAVIQKAAQYEATALKSGKAPTDADWQKEIQSLVAGLKTPSTSSK